MRGAKPAAALAAAVARSLGLERGETLAVAVSGGPDSVALAGLAHAAARDAGASLVLAHVNHGVRARASQDEAVTLALGAALGVPVAIAALAPGSASEARLRDARYVALLAIARARGATRIATAHHARDQTETVLLALFRGTGPEGAAGIAPIRTLADGVSVVRPLLDVEPEALRAYCAAQHFAYALDATNVDVAYRRSALRVLLDDLRPAFPGLDAAVARYARLVREEREGSPRAALRRRIRQELGRAGGTRDVSFERIEALASALERGAAGRHFLRRDLEAVIE